jgi:hypothetical protein
MIAIVFAAALMAAAPAAGDQAAAAAAPAKPAKGAKADKSELVCKKEAVIGSRMKQRVCLSQAEWDQREIDAKADLDAAQRNRPLPSN